MSYSVKEIYYTLQGEGAQAGRAAVFLRFAGCNLWSGREGDRGSALCRFCDTDFVGMDGPGGGRFESAESLAEAVAGHWPSGGGGRPYVVCTGGEPLLQLDALLIDALHAAGFEIAVETNGTLSAPPGIDWICVSPKGAAPLEQRSGHELKLVYPQPEPQAQPHCFVDLAFEHFFVQPMDVVGDAQASAGNVAQAAAYCLEHPQWRLSVQTHKVIGLP
ncbi:MAG: 7-carboxy-7-deazaguanine synthase [Neomegalonema sp.]|nr:7-carboxy-7-deazaguanine synthase [Neomegalonema sp.]